MVVDHIEYLTTTQAAAYLGMSRQWLEIGRHKGYGPPYIKLGRAVRYKRSALDNWMTDRQQLHTASHEIGGSSDV